jgi:hypothetical protein
MIGAVLGIASIAYALYKGYLGGRKIKKAKRKLEEQYRKEREALDQYIIALREAVEEDKQIIRNDYEAWRSGIVEEPKEYRHWLERKKDLYLSEVMG